MRQHVPPEQLWNEFHGDLEFEYEHDVYWPALLKLCEERHAEQVARWVKAGKNYGESEVYLKGGNEESIAGSSVEKSAQNSAVEPVAGQVSVEKARDAAKIEENAPPVDAEVKGLTQTNGTQANGNMDVVAVRSDPVITTEGDRP